MRRITLEDGTWFDADAATTWAEARRWDGNNHISVATGTQYEHEALYRTRKGRWVINRWSDWQGSLERYEEVGEETARRWLAKNDHEHDADLEI